MIPAEGSELPFGAEAEVIRMVREMAAAAAKQGGIVSLIEGDTDGSQLRVIGNRPWAGSPMFVVLEYFGLPFTSDAYHKVLHSVQEGDRGDLFIRAEEDHMDDEPVKAALVQTVGGWGIEEAEQFLAAHKH